MNEQEQLEYLQSLSGCVATICTTGTVLSEYTAAFGNLRSFNDRNGFHKVEYLQIDAKLVEAGRDSAVMHALNEGYDWILQIDADAAPFREDALHLLLNSAYLLHPDSDVMGAYCQIKGDLPLPTIDTGTGTWEVHFPDEGILPVIRTGAHFFLTKCDAFRKMGGPPYFRTRQPWMPLHALREVDNYARTQLDGQNPFERDKAWISLTQSAIKDTQDTNKERYLESKSPLPMELSELFVGEDSGFCDRLKSVGGQIYVDTALVAGHVHKKIIVPDDLRNALDTMDRRRRLAYGVME